ncbi:putative aminodeoxychorismate lyase [Slackia heliotrinireducens]|uniref:Endolytic murein transglycosylase n=1 Tax=Slackia heliotrinireducens (strain ATCC 29202 / DSM 20476 / NCTC 11029 / RHS 1) TaxID=471855 RepID=C7N4K3_SLAHD|nr:endolytic transglycosylase MltG [Slackia heliotrinireducens]ACV21838.1 conserved hypothetical protein TIGR00247 [Slackia heliotrinireducens DSM 20476]VEG99572.1 putative aminodeoxychorismate lyase [Slackia heliotrinireducens]
MPRKQITYSSRPNHRARMVHAQGEKQFRTYDTSHIRPRRSKVPVIVAAVIGVLILVLAGLLLTNFVKGCSSDANENIGETVIVSEGTQVTIPEGATAKDVAAVLADAGLIDDQKAFVKRAAALGADAQFQAGTYTFSEGMTMDQVINAIATGDTGVLTLTVPEGWTNARIATAVEESSKGAITAEDFAAQALASNYVEDYPFVEGAYEDSLEGFLFPKTYNIEPGDTADTLIRKMLDQYAAEVEVLDYTYPESQGLTAYDVLILASIIEKEALPGEDFPTEREDVASVFYNRMAEEMPLQSDATMGYVTGGEVTAADLETESPYNTYLNDGLCPGPICNPSIASLQAACNPSTTDYLYFFIVDEDGYVDHTFSTTLEDHQAAIDRYTNR